jgi:hypothetical protein
LSKNFVITPSNNPQPIFDMVYKADAETYSIDFSPWCEQNHNLTSVTWVSQMGQAGISGAALVGNVASALVTFSEAGGNLIKITATTSAEVHVVYLDVLAKDLLQPDSIEGSLYV